MNFVLGVVFMWLGAALLWVAFHHTDAKTPWDVFSEVIEGVRHG